MFNPVLIIALFLMYIGLLFMVAFLVEKNSASGKIMVNNPVHYAMSLAIYCTSWTYYGVVGMTVNSGLISLSFFIGPTVSIFLWWIFLRKMVRIKNRQRISSIADFISTRYDRSKRLAALVTVVALVGTTPYIALQLRAVSRTFSLITIVDGVNQQWIEPTVPIILTALMALFTIVFGLRKLDPTERHEGMVMALVAESFIKLFAMLVLGFFVSYFLFDGFGDIFTQLDASRFEQMITVGIGDEFTSLKWITILFLSMASVLFLPRQFHVAIVENSDEKHVRQAMWIFPLYLFLITIFVMPIAAAGLLKGLPISQADTFVLQLPIQFGSPWLSILVFIGGASAATGMTMVSGMTLSTMTVNHLMLPLINQFKKLAFLKKRLLHLRWLSVVLILTVGCWFEFALEDSFILSNIGLISFAAAIQFAPVILGGLFWAKGNKTGALWGLTAGFIFWAYTLLWPALIRSGWAPMGLLENGPWGLAFLRPEQLFGLGEIDNLSHGVFWSVFLNLLLYVLGSLLYPQTESEEALAQEYTHALEPRVIRQKRAMPGDAYINVREKCAVIRKLLDQFFEPKKSELTINDCLLEVGIGDREKITIAELAELHDAVEIHLAGSIGSASAHDAMHKQIRLSERESKELSQIYSNLISDLKIPFHELRTKVNYFEERTELLDHHARELEEKIQERDKNIAERILVEEQLIYQKEMWKLLMNISTKYINIALQDIPSATQQAIREVGEFVRADRTYVFDYDFEKRITRNTFEWANEGIESQIEELQNIPLESIPEWVEVHLKGEPFFVPKVEDLPQGHLREIFEAQDIKSLITVPLFQQDELIGFIGFDSVNDHHHYSDRELSILNLLAQVLINLRIRSQSEYALRESQQMLTLLFTSVDQMLTFYECVFDEAGSVNDYRIMSCNDAFKQITGIDPQSVEGKLASRVNKAYPRAYKKEYSLIRENRRIINETIYAAELDKYLIVSVIALSETSFATVTSDVSPIKKAEEELRNLRNYLSNIIDSMPSMLIGVDENAVITQWNNEAYKNTGVKPEYALEKNLKEVFPRLSSELNNISIAIQENRIISLPRKKLRQAEKLIYEDMTIFPLDLTTEKGAVIRIDDVTERVRIEEMIVQSEKMLSVGGLAAGMAHEINNPLAGMLQTASVLKNRLSTNPNLPANLRAAEKAGISIESINQYMQSRDVSRMLDTIVESGRRVAEIVDNMLNFARKGEANMSTYSINEIIEKTFRLAATDYDLKKRYDFRHIEVVRDFEQELPFVPCERGMIQQVLLNILRNGAEAMQQTAGASPKFIVQTRYDRERGMVRLEIADNGPGMDEEIRKRIFEPFYTTKSVGLGTGLGMSVSYFIIAETHGGEIEVESAPGKGTKFIIHLPLQGMN